MTPVAEPMSNADQGFVFTEEDTTAAKLLIDGVPPEAVCAELVARGVPPERAAAVVSRQVEFQRTALRGIGGWMGTAFRVAGFGLLILGGALMFGNRTGIYPTFPFSGLLTMGVGALILVLGGGGKSVYPHLTAPGPGQAD